MIKNYLISLLLILGCQSMAAQTAYKMCVRLQDGSTLAIPVDDIESITFPTTVSPTEALTGRWLLVAAPMGHEGEGGVYSSKPDTIRFTAYLSADGSTLRCHADTLCLISGTVIPADWQVTVERNPQSGTCRLGWVLSESMPAQTLSGEYLYLLSENIATQQLEGMTLWSEERPDGSSTYTFPRNQEVYGVLSTASPYSNPPSGFIEIWASPRFIKLDIIP